MELFDESTREQVNMNTFIPLIVLLAALVIGIILIKRCFKYRSPAEKTAFRKGMIAAILTNDPLFGHFFAKKNSDYDFDEKRLK